MLASIVSITACGEPGFEFHGTVVDADGRPVENAGIELTCYGSRHHTALSDLNGRFRGIMIGVFGDECVIDVKHSSATISFEVMRNCARRYDDDRCREVKLDVRLPRP